jgi:polyphosphate glucokinase
MNEHTDDRGPAPSVDGLLTLAIDIGGSSVKASILGPDGAMVAERVSNKTPEPATPEAVLCCIESLAAQLPTFGRISAGFPGVVKAGHILTAPNLGTEYWIDFNLAEALERRLDAPARVLNDAAVQGLGVIEGRGLECVLTLGTGVGCALYRNNRLILPMEFGQSIARGKKTYDMYLGNAALRKKGRSRWNRRLKKALDAIRSLVNFDVLYLGGGNAQMVDLQLPEDIRIVSNSAGITGGVRLWEPEMGEFFVPRS